MRRSLAAKVLIAGAVLTVASFGTCSAFLGPALSTALSGETDRTAQMLGSLGFYGFFAGLGILVIGLIMIVAEAIGRRHRDRDEPPG